MKNISSELNHVRNTIFPSFWLEVEAYVQDNCLNFIRFSVSILPALLFWAGIGWFLYYGINKVKTFRLQFSWRIWNNVYRLLLLEKEEASATEMVPL